VKKYCQDGATCSHVGLHMSRFFSNFVFALVLWGGSGDGFSAPVDCDSLSLHLTIKMHNFSIRMSLGAGSWITCSVTLLLQCGCLDGWGPPLSELSSFATKATASLCLFVSSFLRLFTSSCVCVVCVFGWLFLGEFLHELSKCRKAQAQGTSHCMHAFAAMQ
jgi:hypothetical protein